MAPLILDLIRGPGVASGLRGASHLSKQDETQFARNSLDVIRDVLQPHWHGSVSSHREIGSGSR